MVCAETAQQKSTSQLAEAPTKQCVTFEKTTRIFHAAPVAFAKTRGMLPVVSCQWPVGPGRQSPVTTSHQSPTNCERILELCPSGANSLPFGTHPERSRLVFQGRRPARCDKRGDFWNTESCFSSMCQKSKIQWLPIRRAGLGGSYRNDRYLQKRCLLFAISGSVRNRPGAEYPGGVAQRLALECRRDGESTFSEHFDRIDAARFLAGDAGGA